MRNRTRRLFAIVLSLVIMCIVVEPVSATTISDLENQIEQNQNALEDINNQIDDMESAQDLLEEEIADINSEMINLMTSIGLLEENIARKEVDIAAAEVEYQKALETEQKQYAAMLVRMQFMYEQGSDNMLTLLFGAENFYYLSGAGHGTPKEITTDKNGYAKFDKLKLGTYRYFRDIERNNLDPNTLL
mgnify:CR=1 FL=1